MKKYLISIFALTLFISLVTGCGKAKSEVNYNGIIENSKVPSSDTTETSDNEDIKLYSDNSKIVFDTGNGMLVFYYSGNDITKYEAYINYGDSQTAKFALSLLDEAEENIINKYTKGKYLVVEYAESEFDGLTLDDIKATYSYLKEVSKSN